MLLGCGSDAFTQAKERNDMKLTKEEIVAALKANVCAVTFTKVNGETRTMPCTLKEDIVPAYERKTPVKEATVKESATLSVWCTDKGAWRSFRVGSVTNLEIQPKVVDNTAN
jgi:acyl-ACP thioesterase